MKHAFFNPEYYRWAKEHDLDVLEHAGYSRFLRYFEYVPVNMVIAYCMLAVPKLGMPLSFVCRRSLLICSSSVVLCIIW